MAILVSTKLLLSPATKPLLLCTNVQLIQPVPVFPFCSVINPYCTRAYQKVIPLLQSSEASAKECRSGGINLLEMVFGPLHSNTQKKYRH